MTACDYCDRAAHWQIEGTVKGPQAPPVWRVCDRHRADLFSGREERGLVTVRLLQGH